MAEPGDLPKYTPQTEYSQGLKGYIRLQNSLRTLERLNRYEPFNDIDEQRHALHERLKVLAGEIGKTPDDLRFDLLLEEGNLQEWNINAPVIRLPMVGVAFRYDEQEGKVINYDRVQPVRQVLYSPSGEFLATTQPKKDHNVTVDKKRNKKEVLQRWDREPFGAIIFSRYMMDHGVTHIPVLHSTRLERRTNLARDFALNLYQADDMSGHQMYTPTFIYGVEVPMKVVGEIALAMKEHRDKYWLTEDEEKDPYNRRFLKNEKEYLGDYLYNELRAGLEGNNWQSWYNFLRVFDVSGIVSSGKNIPDFQERITQGIARAY